MPIKTKKKEAINAPKKARRFETRDIEEVAKISQALYKAKIAFKISVKTYAPGEAVKFRFTADPMTDEKREEILKAVRK